ncbi:PRC-barrel domain-containing protein [Cellulosimicrobium sp. TH-20]|uniref:PRC-barrel domain-containing protein n=1 Tax=Cellulosimicrobium sp. TH-20 TaxID=1980001 RepID=UPI0011A54068|nr:PRC-barrel domain-containing protein [Cellulosimicrobium sp. TH-20]
MISTDQIERLLAGGTVVTEDGEKIGKVGQVFVDDRTGEPDWVTVKTGLFGTGESFVPLAEADVQGDEIRVPFDKDRVKGAPRVDDAGGHLSHEEEDALYRYYGRDTSDAARGGGERDSERRDPDDGAADEGDVVGKHAAGPADDLAAFPADPALTGEQAPTRMRLRRYVVTEYVEETAPDGETGPDDARRETSGEGGQS